jgi:ribonuclease III
MTFEDLEKQIGITFKDKNLLKLAFIHRSYLNEDKNTKISNERLEFLGDAVLSFLTSHYLYQKYPDFPEGILTNIRSGLVKTKTLSLLSKKLNLGSLLFLSKGEEDSNGRNNTSLLADCFEALLGAIFLDQGVPACQKFLEINLFPESDIIVNDKLYIDYKSHLQEIVQEQTKISPTYKVVKSEGPDHDKTFWMAAMRGDIVLGQGVGKSKQEAEQAAAQNALEKLGQK